MDLGSIIPAMLIPGIIGTRTEKAIASTPTSVSLRYWAALGLQKMSGANSSHMPVKQAAHCPNQAVRFDSDMAQKRQSRRPPISALAIRIPSRHSTGGHPRSHKSETRRLGKESVR